MSAIEQKKELLQQGVQADYKVLLAERDHLLAQLNEARIRVQQVKEAEKDYQDTIEELQGSLRSQTQTLGTVQAQHETVLEQVQHLTSEVRAQSSRTETLSREKTELRKQLAEKSRFISIHCNQAMARGRAISNISEFLSFPAFFSPVSLYKLNHPDNPDNLDNPRSHRALCE